MVALVMILDFGFQNIILLLVATKFPSMCQAETLELVLIALLIQRYPLCILKIMFEVLNCTLNNYYDDINVSLSKHHRALKVCVHLMATNLFGTR